MAQSKTGTASRAMIIAEPNSSLEVRESRFNPPGDSVDHLSPHRNQDPGRWTGPAGGSRMKGLTIQKKVHFGRGRKSRKVLREGPVAETPIGRTPRISKLMALALRFDRLISDGEITDQADLARLGQVSRARVTQIMNLLQLAPDIQEEILFLPQTLSGRDPIRKRHIRPLTTILDWRKQRRLWKQLQEKQNIEITCVD